MHAWKISLFIFCNEIWYLTKKEKFHCERWKLHRFCCHTSAALTNRLKGPGSRLVCTKKRRRNLRVASETESTHSSLRWPGTQILITSPPYLKIDKVNVQTSLSVLGIHVLCLRSCIILSDSSHFAFSLMNLCLWRFVSLFHNYFYVSFLISISQSHYHCFLYCCQY